MTESILDIAGRLLESETIEEAAQELKAYGALVNLPRIAAIADYASPDLVQTKDGEPLAKLFGWSDEIISQWTDQRLTLQSMSAAVCRVTTHPFVWNPTNTSTITDNPSPKKKRIADYMRNEGMNSAITIPTHLPLGRVGSVSWFAADPNTDLNVLIKEIGNNLRIMSIAFMDVVYQERQERTIELGSVELTERELECLTWVALGKTDAEIAIIIARSPATARFHIDNAVSKLDSTTRSQAVAKASQLGLIGPIV